jgi:hypothetical protein
MTPKEYEEAVLERFKTAWPPPQFVVRHNVRLTGQATKVRRQIDVAIYEQGSEEPSLIVEVKRHMRAVDAPRAGATIALVQDIGGIPAIMVSTQGFSIAAANHLTWEGIGHLTVTLTEALGLRWVPLVEHRFAVDRQFRELSGDMVEALRVGNAAVFMDCDLPYEEWIAVMAVGQSLFPLASSRLLRSLATDHYDDAVRYNALQLLDDAGELETDFVNGLLEIERDLDVLELLKTARL